jgi:uncharacterized NAD(P)/FAD-binding protein YdhS
MVHEDLQSDLAAKSLSVRAGRIQEIKKQDEHWTVTFTDRRLHQNVTENFNHVIMATGSVVDQSLLSDKDILGINRCEFGFGYSKETNTKVWLAGPSSKSDHWEITAIPEISDQALAIAKEIADY